MARLWLIVRKILHMRLMRITLWVQATYTMVTALWGLLDIHSFMKVTGPKADIWLVKTVSVLLIAISLVYFYFLIRKKDPWPIITLALGTAIGLAGIDLYYALGDIISPIYLLDALLQLIFAGCWISIGLNQLREPAD